MLQWQNWASQSFLDTDTKTIKEMEMNSLEVGWAVIHFIYMVLEVAWRQLVSHSLLSRVCTTSLKTKWSSFGALYGIHTSSYIMKCHVLCSPDISSSSLPLQPVGLQSGSILTIQLLQPIVAYSLQQIFKLIHITTTCTWKIPRVIVILIDPTTYIFCQAKAPSGKADRGPA